MKRRSEPRPFLLPLQAQHYQPPAIEAIPLLKWRLPMTRPDWTWIEPETQKVEHASWWASYSEHIPALNVSYPEGMISITIDMLWQDGMRLHCLASPAYHMQHDMQFTQHLLLEGEREQYTPWTLAYAQLKNLALEWLSYGRAYLYRSLLLDVDERWLMGNLAILEMHQSSKKALATVQITATTIARQCGWFITPLYHACKVPDTQRVLFHLTSLVEREYLKTEETGPARTTYATIIQNIPLTNKVR